MPPVLARHIKFDFTLLDSNGIPRQPNDDEYEKVLHALPNNKGFKVVGPFLIVHVDKLPPKPWPVSVAGLALFLTTNQFELPWKLGLAGDPRFKVLSNRDCRASSTREDYDTVVSYFASQEIYVRQVVWLSGIWRLQIEYREGLKLPGQICQITAFYVFDKDGEAGLTERALREKKPSSTAMDDSSYYSLRPGISIASNSRTTTSGVLVKDTRDRNFFTAASHGFLDNETVVHHPTAQGQIIGELVERVGEGTDIGLVELAENFSFHNETFDYPGIPATTIKSLRDPRDLKIADPVFIDTPFSGTMDGLFIAVGQQENQGAWVETLWSWFGQDPNMFPVPGVWGAAVLDSEGDVLSFLHHYSETDHVGIGASSYELIKRGYTLQKT